MFTFVSYRELSWRYSKAWSSTFISCLIGQTQFYEVTTGQAGSAVGLTRKTFVDWWSGIFPGRMPFLSPSEQCHSTSTEGTVFSCTDFQSSGRSSSSCAVSCTPSFVATRRSTVPDEYRSFCRCQPVPFWSPVGTSHRNVLSRLRPNSASVHSHTLVPQLGTLRTFVPHQTL